jgi:hypothetical protein
MTRQFDAIVGAGQGVGTVPTCGSAVFGVFNGDEVIDIVYDEDTRPPLPTSVSHPNPQACTRCWPWVIVAMAARVEAAWKSWRTTRSTSWSGSTCPDRNTQIRTVPLREGKS